MMKLRTNRATMEFPLAGLKMLLVIVLSLVTLIHQCLGADSIDKLLKKHPTWSFEVQSVEAVIKDALHKHKLNGNNFELTETMLREKMRRSLAPGATHIVRKVGDPKWESNPENVPHFFDAREHWKDCASLMNQIEDQGACRTDGPGVVSSLMADRYCIFTNGTFKEKLSQEMLMRCAEACTHDSFQLYSWEYATEEGIPTGGAYGSGKGCMPYRYPPCDHTSLYDVNASIGKAKLEECKGQFIFDDDCPTKCTNKNYKTSIDKDRVKFTAFYFLSMDEFYIRNEIMTYGPVSASVGLYSDFLEKPDGIFQSKEDRIGLEDEKLMKIIGWGKENGIKYWLCMHTWDTWGDKVFKMPRGVNYDQIELIVLTGVFEDLDAE
nr:PREDICTED: cathepsin B-like cysteine proteinase 4 [Bemisia tabaci]